MATTETNIETLQKQLNEEFDEIESYIDDASACKDDRDALGLFRASVDLKDKAESLLRLSKKVKKAEIKAVDLELSTTD